MDWNVAYRARNKMQTKSVHDRRKNNMATIDFLPEIGHTSTGIWCLESLHYHVNLPLIDEEKF